MEIDITPEDTKIIDKWIFILLGSNSGEKIRGRLRMTKELFLISKTISPELEKPFNFFPYQFGPYSSRLAMRMNDLIETKQLSLVYTQRDWAYLLTQESLDGAKELLKTLSSDVRKRIEALKHRMKRMSTRRIIKEIYNKYPEYTLKSAISPDVIYVAKIDLAKEHPIDDGPGFIASSQENELKLNEEKTRLLVKTLNKG